MADISKITLPDSSEYNIKDATARSIANGKSTVSVSQTLTSGTEIATVTVNGTATSLYAPQGESPTALTDAEIEAAVDEAFAVSYSITKGNSAIWSIKLEKSITAAEITEAKAGTTVYVMITGTVVTTSPSVTVTRDGTLEGLKVFKFTMPESNITVSGSTPK